MQEPEQGRSRFLAGSLAVVAMGLAVGYTWNRYWAPFDIFMYLGAVREFATSGFDASHPFAVEADNSPYLSPYTMVLGFVSRLTGLSPVVVLQIAALVNGVALAAALARFARSFTNSRWVGTILIVTTLFCWGWSPWRWAGYFNANGIGSVLPLGSTFAAVCVLVGLASTLKWLQGQPWGHLATVGATFALAVVTHPMTALWGVLICGGFILSTGAAARRAGLVIVGLGAFLATIAWPYYSVLDLFSAAGNASNEILAPNARVLRLVPLRTFLAFPGLVALWARWRSSHRDPLVAASACVGAVFIFALLTGHGVLGRTLPGLMLCLHTAMAVWMADYLARRAPRTTNGVSKDPVILGAAVILLVGIAASAPGLVRAVPRPWLPEGLQTRAGTSRVAPYLALLPGPIPPGDTMIASEDLSLGAVALSVKSISPPVEPPLWAETEIQHRADIQAQLLHEDLPWNERVVLLSEHHVDWLVINPADLVRLEVPTDLIVRTKPALGSIVRVP